MIKPTLKEFEELAGRYDLVPVFRELLADLETPVSAFARIADDPYAFLLESVEGGEQWGRYSLIGMDPAGVYTVENGCPYLEEGGRRRALEVDDGQGPLDPLRNRLAAVNAAEIPGLPRFFGGAVGYLGYEMAGCFEVLPPPKNDTGWPQACFLLTDRMLIFDNVRHTIIALACVRPRDFGSPALAYEHGLKEIETLCARLNAPLPARRRPDRQSPVEMAAGMDRACFEAMVERVRRYIYDGDIIQAVLSQKFSSELTADPLTVYRALRLINPSPYTFFVKMGRRMLVGSSPEVMVRQTGRGACLRPIAGTRRRGSSEQEDRALADELLSDEKERAEHVMLVDLGRNDLGRVARTGSVQVRDFMTVERYSHVMHIVSHIEAQLRDECDAFDLLAATFPAGTLTGAPKLRAMEIIHELEPCARGPYGGALGYFGYNERTDLAITIRTLQIENGNATVQAGAGIVYDSDPAREYEETRNKALGMVRALELAASGLELGYGNVAAEDYA